MKTLCLIRHAKSSWHSGIGEDIDRPLDERGEANAKLMGDFLHKEGIKPDMILTSHAKRANDTANLIAQSFSKAGTNIIINENLYEAGVEDLLHVIQDLDNKFNSVIIVGHNPGLTWLANYLADDHMINLPTCGVYCVDFNTNDWHKITVVEGNTRLIDSPKKHEG